METIELIQALSQANGVSGFEDEVLEIARNYCDKGLSIEEDRLRNLYLGRGGKKKDRPVVMLDAHSDEVGFMIQSINANGTMKFLPLGGWNPQTLGAHAVLIRNTENNWVRGVIASKPTHFLTAAEKNQPASIAGMVIDVGAVSEAEVSEKFNIKIGAPVVPQVMFSHDKSNDLMIGKAFDDRLGCAALLKTIRETVAKDLKVELRGALSTQEELGLRGVKVSVNKISPDIAIALEGTPADDTFGSGDSIQAGIKKGPQIRHMDSSVLCNPRFVKFAVDIAKKHDIPFQEAVRTGGGNNAAVITLHDRGIPCITLGVPVRYIHSHHCIASLEDFNNTVKWCKEILNALDRSTIEGF